MRAMHPHARDVDLDVELELIDDELGALPDGDVHAIDPVHPLRRLGAWVRNAPRPRA